MAYKSYNLSNIYGYVLENNADALTAAKLSRMSPEDLKAYLLKQKQADPAKYGRLLVDLYVNTGSRENLLNAFY